jgi:acyl-CoA thioesterase I
LRYPSLALSRLLLLFLVSALGCSGSEDPPTAGTAMGGAGASGASGAGASAGGTSGAGAAGAGAGGLASAGNSGAGGTPAPGGSAGAGSDSALESDARLMVLGSSNELITCWRAFLWQKLQDAGRSEVDFVGDVNSGPDCGVPGYDMDLRAQSGIIISDVSSEQFATWFAAHPPQVVLMHFGGADLLNGLPISGVIDAYTRALEAVRAVTPDVIMLAGQHTPMDSSNCECATTVLELNAAMETWAAEQTTAGSPVIPVDLFTGLDLDDDFSDRVHLNESGSEKVAQRFFDALEPHFTPSP